MMFDVDPPADDHPRAQQGLVYTLHSTWVQTGSPNLDVSKEGNFRYAQVTYQWIIGMKDVFKNNTGIWPIVSRVLVSDCQEGTQGAS